MTNSDPFKVERDDHIAWLTLNRPEKRNEHGDVRAESALRLDQSVTLVAQAKISQIRCAWYFAPCHRSENRRKKRYS